MTKNYFKRLSMLAIISLMTSTMNAQAPSFTVGAPGNNYTLSCINSPITMTAMAGTAPISYTWSIAGSTITGNYANVSLPGNWTVVAQNTITSATSQQTFSIASNFTSPNVAVTPTVQNVTCNAAASCFTATCNMFPNITTNWFQVIAGNTLYVGVPQGTINILCPSSPGVYWFEAKNNLTGCVNTKSVLVTVSVGVPQFTVTSPTNFTVGCSSTSITSMQVSSVVTSPVQNVAVGYTFCPPPATVVITPTTALSANPNQNNITTPGIWVVYVKDLTNNCMVSQSINIIQNIAQPSIYDIQPLNLLSCLEPTMSLTGISSNSNTAITWTMPATPFNIVNPTPIATTSINSAILGSSVNLTALGFYTLGVSDNNNLCRSTITLQINQDIRKPAFSITALTNSVITCLNTDVLIAPIITPTLAVALVPTYMWFPPPAGPGVPGTQYDTQVAGTHTVIAKSVVNGCTYTATYNVAIDMMVSASDSIIGAACPINTILISPVYSNTVGLSFVWSGPNGAILTPTNQSTIIGSSLGNYSCVVTNTVNGCSKTVTCSVVCNTGLQSNSLDYSLKIFPNPSNGKIVIEMNGIPVNTKIILYDAQGKLLFEKELKEKRNVIDLDLPKGYYLYEINQSETRFKKQKLIIY